MLLRNVFTKTVRDGRRALSAWALGTAAVAAMYASFYPQLAGGAMTDVLATFPQALRDAFRLDDISSAAGYLQSTTFGLLVPLLITMYGIATGTRALAGDEEAGHLDVLITHPVSRTRLLVHRFAALATGATVIAGVVFAVMLAIRSGARLDTVLIGGFAGQCLNAALLAMTFGALAIALGAAGAGRGLVLGVSAGIGVLAYAANTFGAQLGVGWARDLSPFHHYLGGEPLRNGVQWVDAGILAAMTAVLLAVGVWSFNRRDLT
ncbi:ABC transporter permease subunit [Umezawaea sp.]|uniref:ABC transporter permease subunit n=1 Tax=Umezawaea sp. TaxID=1955258 RepID=UPI002ED09099